MIINTSENVNCDSVNTTCKVVPGARVSRVPDASWLFLLGRDEERRQPQLFGHHGEEKWRRGEEENPLKIHFQQTGPRWEWAIATVWVEIRCLPTPRGSRYTFPSLISGCFKIFLHLISFNFCVVAGNVGRQLSGCCWSRRSCQAGSLPWDGGQPGLGLQ